jgi:hypothetical protein
MCWVANCRGVVPSSEEISVVDSIIFFIDLWLLVDEVSILSLNILTTQTMVITGILPLREKFPW